MTLICKECGAEVKVIDGELKKSCEHETAAIIMPLEVVCTGKGTTK